jgi:enoyl-CoA hydratase/carnithine racemase
MAPEAEERLVTREQHGPVTVLTMVYRPHNLLGPKLLGAIAEQVTLAQETGSRALILKSGLRHFSAGADLDQFDALIEKAGRSDATPSPIDFVHRLESLPIPIVASIHGVCLGGGLELALACDYIVAAASSKIGSVEVTLGLAPLMGGIQRQVQRIGAARAKEMSMLGRRYDPATLERWGLLNLVVADEALEDATMSVAQELARGPTVAHRTTKELVSLAASEGVSAADQAMAKIQQPIWRSEDLKIGLASFRKNGVGLAKFEGR